MHAGVQHDIAVIFFQYSLLSRFNLEFCVEEGILVLQNESETLAVVRRGDGRISVTYHADDVGVAEKTLRGCLGSVSSWSDGLKTLKARHGYGSLPVFRKTLSYAEALDVCSYLGARMAASDSGIQIAINQTLADYVCYLNN